MLPAFQQVCFGDQCSCSPFYFSDNKQSSCNDSGENDKRNHDRYILIGINGCRNFLSAGISISL